MKHHFTATKVIILLLAAAWPVVAAHRPTQPPPALIAFDLEMKHIVVQVTINRSRPLSFVLDTGADKAVIRTEVARELGLKLEGTVTAGGAGAGTQAGSFVRDAKWSLVGLNGFSQPITFALPLPELSSTMGRALDGIVGGEFLKEFVVDLDYQARALRLHDPRTFRYEGPGEAVPIEFVSGTQPVVPATVTPVGRAPIRGRFLFDVGAGLALALHSPLVKAENLPGEGQTTIRSIGAGGAGGRTVGQLGRVESLGIGSFSLKSPITLFSQDTRGSFANASLSGNIGAQVAMRFRLFLDYGRRRIIFEPSASFDAPFDRALSGLALRAQGSDYRTFRVVEVLENSPGTDAGIAEGDVITAIDDVPAAQLTLTRLSEMLEKSIAYRLVLRRGDQVITVTLTPRRLI